MNYVHGGDIYTHKNILDFSTNINPLGIPESVRNAAISGILQSHHYPDSRCYDLRRALSLHEQLPLNSIICGNGAADLIFSLCLYVKPKKALLLAPTFAEYEQALTTIQCDINYFNLNKEHDFLLTKGYLNYLTPDLDMIFLCNPNNPTGVPIAKDFMEEILQICELNHILLVVDECFMDFLDTPEEYTLKHKIKESNYLFIIKAFTKMYAMAGLRLGYGLTGNKNIIDGIHSVTQPWNVSIPASQAGIAALLETDFVANTKSLIKKERDYLLSELDALSIKTYGSKANYIFFEGPYDLYENMLQEHILIRSCGNYRGLETNYYRIAVKTHKDNQTFINCFKKYVKERK